MPLDLTGLLPIGKEVKVGQNRFQDKEIVIHGKTLICHVPSPQISSIDFKNQNDFRKVSNLFPASAHRTNGNLSN